MESLENSFDNKSIEILLNASFEFGDLENIYNLYQKCLLHIEKESNQVTWRSLESCLQTFSRLGKKKECIEIYEKYKASRIKASTEYNSKYNLSRPTTDLQENSSFSRLYMLPEPPRDILYQMAYVFGYNHDSESILKFFKEEVFDSERLLLYQYRKDLGLSKEIKNYTDKSQKKINNIRSHKGPQSNLLIRKYKDSISRNNKSLKRNQGLQVGESGPVAIVYQGLIQGWKKGIENLGNDSTESTGSYYIQMDNLVNELVEFESCEKK